MTAHIFIPEPQSLLLHPCDSRARARVRVHVYLYLYIKIFRIRELSDRFYVRSNDRLFEPTGNSLTAAFHRRDLPRLSVFHLSFSLSHSFSSSFFFFLSRKFLESQRGGEVYVSTCTPPIVTSREFLESAMGNETTPTALHNAARTTRPFPERIDPLDKVSTNNVAWHDKSPGNGIYGWATKIE